MPYIIQRPKYVCKACLRISDVAADCCGVPMSAHRDGITINIPTREEIEAAKVEDETQELDKETGAYPLRPLTPKEKEVMLEKARRELTVQGVKEL